MPRRKAQKSKAPPASIEHMLNLPTPLDQAKYSIPLFLSHYFLDADGAADKTKTTYALALPHTKRAFDAKLNPAVRAIPGLWMEVSGNGFSEKDQPYKVACIGWTNSALVAARQGNAKVVDAVLAAKEAVREAKRLEQHRAYLQSLTTGDGLQRTNFDITGAYTIACPSIDEQWSDRNEMELHVRQSNVEGLYEARFKLRVLDGVMLLSTDREQLVKQFNIRERSRIKDSEWDWFYMKESGRWFDDKTSPLIEKVTTGSKRKACDGEEQTGGSVKRRKGAKSTAPAPHPRRFWLIWLGRETGEGEWQGDYDDNHTGCLEFADDKFTVFKGQMNLEFVGGDDMIYGRKLSDMPSKKPDRDSSWSKFN